MIGRAAATFFIRAPKHDRADSWIERAFDWPQGAVSARRNMDGSVAFTTRDDLLRARREQMERCLWAKRECGVVSRRALSLWVFWCPGLAGFAFRGWWAYLQGVGGREVCGGGVKGNVAGAMLAELMQMFPVPNPHPLLPLSPYEWKPLFARHYQRGRHCRRPQGRAAIWADMRGDQVQRLLGPAQGARHGGAQRSREATP